MNKQILQTVGLHPLVAFGMIVVDMMLFGADTTGVGWFASCFVASLLVLPCILLQRYAYKDTWLIAISKGCIVGIITAIPTPLPAVLTGIGGVLGLLGITQNYENKA